MARPPAASSRTAWVRAVEDASLQRTHPQEQEAADRFDALASPAQQMALAREIVGTRARELTLAYRNVVMVAAGFKSRVGAGGVDEVHPEPCVIFVVKRKWDTGARPQPGQSLPRQLLTYGSEGGERRLYAVPTDVQPVQWYLGGTARSASCVFVDDPQPQFRLPGVLTCGVTLRGAPAGAGNGFALSAMHVLSPVARQALPAEGSAIAAVGAGPAVRGRSAAWGGHLDAQNGSAFDVQLAELTDTAWFSRAFEDHTLSSTRPYVASPGVFDELAAGMRFQILAPANHPQHLNTPRDPMLAQFLMVNGGEMPLKYQLRVGGALQTFDLRHRELIMLKVLDDCPSPESGDSGSPVITWWPDGSATLVGMFIGSGNAAGRERLVYVNPAWQVFDPANWNRLPPGAVELTPSFSLP